jgi:mono/diheme cytochrome c family protein
MTKRKIAANAMVMICLGSFPMACHKPDPVTPAPSTPQSEAAIQGWTMQDRQTFAHTSQGTRFFPYKWLHALEEKDLFSKKLFMTAERIANLQLIPDDNTVNNPDRLPVGMAKEVAADGKEFVSITCSGCHTAQIKFNNTLRRIDGGPVMHSPGMLVGEAYVALLATSLNSGKFNRFAERVLGASHTQAERQKLKGDVNAALKDPALLAQLHGFLSTTKEGFGRLDALGRGGNLVLATRMGDIRNLVSTNAPVSYPHLWGTPSFDWVQWNGSISQPLARNIAEALGVQTPITLKSDNPADLFKSDVNLQNLVLLEEILKKLEPPRWPADLLGPIDQAKAAKGAALYDQHCASCHESKLNPPNEFGKQFLRINMSPLPDIGTDPTTAVNFEKRMAFTNQLSKPPINLPPKISVASALEKVTDQVAQRKFAELNIAPEMQDEMRGFRKNIIRAPLAYRARNMDGIWATAPYLHNNSVPNLYQLLLPAAQRDKSFYVGSLQYDPKVLGFVTTNSPGAFRFRTNITGNSNVGHEYRDGPLGKGIIGPLLTEEERWAIIEYLKTR